MTARLRSLDAFRGLVVLAMIFVNYLHDMPNVPPFMKHARASADAITVPDFVFPAFLFMTGVAIPLSLDGSIAGGVPLGRLLARIVPRAMILMLLGVVYEYRGEMVPEHTGLSLVHWMSMFYLGALLALNRYPATDDPKRLRWYVGLRVGGALLVAAMLAIYRGKATPDGGYEWMHHGWWGILGLIGWGYLEASLVYLMLGGSETALLASLGLMLALYMGGRHGLTDALGSVNDFVSVPTVLGSISANVMAGVVVGRRLVDREASASSRLRFLVAFGCVLLAAGFLLRPVHGFSKIGATESYTLVTAGCASLAFGAFYWAIEVRGWIADVPLLGLVGAHPLLAYLVPDLWEHAVALVGAEGAWRATAWHFYERGGAAGMVNAGAISVLMLALTAVLVRSGVRLRV